jgi:hypothetical protein
LNLGTSLVLCLQFAQQAVKGVLVGVMFLVLRGRLFISKTSKGGNGLLLIGVDFEETIEARHLQHPFHFGLGIEQFDVLL